MNWQFVAAVVLLFLMVLLGFGAAYEWWRKNRSSEAKRINERLENLSSGVIDARNDVESILKSRRLSESSLLNSALEQLPSTRMLDQYLLQAGLRWSVGYFVGLSATLGLAVLIVLGLLRFPALTALPIAALCLFLPTFYVRYKHAKRLQKFEQQLPEACDMLARALRSGHAFTSAMQMVGTEFADPMGTEFRLAFGEINYGVPIGEALTNLVKRVPIRDLRYFVIAVVQLEAFADQRRDVVEQFGEVAARLGHGVAADRHGGHDLFDEPCLHQRAVDRQDGVVDPGRRTGAARDRRVLDLAGREDPRIGIDGNSGARPRRGTTWSCSISRISRYCSAYSRS